MCGIAGIVKLDPAETVDEARLKRMRDVLRHRGPDGEGLWIDGPVGLGHRRLAIVDVAGRVEVAAADVVGARVGVNDVTVVGAARDVVVTVDWALSLLATDPLLPVQVTRANADTTAKPQITMTHHGRGTARNRSPTVTAPTLTAGVQDLAAIARPRRV